jgi:hypothetical protein
MQPMRGTRLAAALTAAALLGCSSSSDNAGAITSMDEIANAIDAEDTSAQEIKQSPSGVKKESDNTSQSREISLADVREILKPREVDVEVMGFKTPADMARISAALDKSSRENSQWLLQYIKTHARQGQPLPYHPNFGITEDDYRRFGEYLNAVKLVPAAKARLRFTAQSDSKALIQNVEGLPAFDGIVIDYENNQVKTPWGTGDADEPEYADEGSALGRWDGYFWQLEEGKAESGKLTKITFAVGRQLSEPYNIMHYRAVAVTAGVKAVDIETVIRFPQ